MFLPDRYVKGECPVCHTRGPVRRLLRELRLYLHARQADQPRLDASSAPRPCGASPSTTSSSSAISPTCCASGLEGGGARQPEVRAKLAEWFEAGLQDWDISRDAPYFGFEIPGAPGKYFYVWFDAPIGYLGSFKALCDKRGLELRRVPEAPTAPPSCITSSARTSATSTTCSGPRCCTARAAASRRAVFVHGFLTINGAKMSKSRGTFITARRYLELPAARAAAFLLREQAQRRRRRHRPVARGFRRARELRHRRQAREHRQPLRGLRAARRRQARGPTTRSARCTTEFAALRGTIADLYDARDYSAAHRAASWVSPIAPTSTSTRTSPGRSRRIRRRPPRSSRSARRASTCSACS